MLPILFGLNIDPGVRAAGLAGDLATLADELGYDLIGIQDHPYIGQYLDTWTLLSVLGARTNRVKLFPNVADLPLRPPAMLAKAAASLDILTEGRVILGIGAGARWEQIAGMGGPRRTPGEALQAVREGIEVMRALWGEGGEGDVTYQGQIYRLQDVEPGPTPPQPIPIWVGAYGPRMLRLVGRMANGWSPSEPYAPPDQIPLMQQTINEAAREVGRDPDQIRRNYNLLGTILSGQSRVRARQPGMRFALVQEWVEVIVRYVLELGMDSFVYWPVAGGEREQARIFASEVMPRVKEQLEPRT